MKKVCSQHPALMVGASVSLVFLAGLLWFQHEGSSILNLQSRWLMVSGTPLLAALIVGGYIKSFKGFGLELETNLNKPIGDIGLTAARAMVSLDAGEKQSVNTLRAFTSKEKWRISRLVLKQGRKNYYEVWALEEYIRLLTKLKYIEVQNNEGKFVALIPIDEFKSQGEKQRNKLNRFIDALEKSEIESSHVTTAITTTITKETGLIEALQIMRRLGMKELVVLDKEGVFRGVLLSSDVEKCIADFVLQAKKGI